MQEQINKMQKQIDGMQQMIIALIVTQDRMTQFKIRKAYPSLDEMMNKMWL